jgi:AcrR family transcriptional regulator
VTTITRRGERRTQAQRRAQTQEALLDATLACLTDLGFARTTTTEIARRAGVSLGALSHHFPTKNDVLAAAVDHLLTRRLADFRAAVAEAPSADRVAVALDLLWSAFSGPAFVAWVELWVGARTDPGLRPAVLEVSDAFREGARVALHELFAAEDPASYEPVLDFVFTVMDGAGLRALVRPPDATSVTVLKRMAALWDLREATGRPTTREELT